MSASSDLAAGRKHIEAMFSDNWLLSDSGMIPARLEAIAPPPVHFATDNLKPTGLAAKFISEAEAKLLFREMREERIAPTRLALMPDGKYRGWCIAPIVVCDVGGAMAILDGNHRAAIANELKEQGLLTTVPAWVAPGSSVVGLVRQYLKAGFDWTGQVGTPGCALTEVLRRIDCGGVSAIDLVYAGRA